MANGQKIRIAARLRPRLSGEVDDDAIKICHSLDDTGASSSSAACQSFITVPNPANAAQIFKFPFSSCYDQTSTQEEIFRNDVEPLVDVVYNGVTVTIFAYGVTSSGKTHTMQGTKSEPGVIPRVVRSLFEKKAALNHPDTQLSVSYMEIYKDEVYDLLVTRENAPKLPVRENGAGQVFVANLSSIPLQSVQDFDSIYARTTKQRSVGATKLNHASSRSHAVLTIEVTMTDHQQHRTVTGKMNLVDLAGSENNKLTGNDASRMQESAAINKSLSVLGQVVRNLNTGETRIPFRNSKLTRILQDALGGSSVGLLICNVAPGIKFRKDTLNTLNFAVSAKNVENKPVVNERDSRPAPKPHFAALTTQHTVPKLAQIAVPAPAPPARASGSQVPRSRTSLLPKPRASTFGSASFQPFTVSSGSQDRISAEGDRSASMGLGLTDKEIDEKISKAVEAEVARILEEREKGRLEKEKEKETRMSPGSGRHKSRSPKKESAPLPSGVLTPLLKRHRDLDDELKARLQELERKFERGNKETALADALSPVSRKKTGRAYVALARAHSDKGDLQVALDLYRKAESYVPDNIKLKERIIQIEWAVDHAQPYVPSPKKTKKKKEKVKMKEECPMSDEQMDVDAVAEALGAEFGTELTNMEIRQDQSPGERSSKRIREQAIDDGTPAKRPRKAKKAAVIYSSDEEYIPVAPVKRSRRKAAAA
ncbi:kinesin-like protein [Desarmillaria tabescens]|uniref:Kinesin-like protein n=1 Tax=Armillaria tabescens TaxID=1929756 RepID=A0AA39N1P2_ARMTA|nr:kinesin-like protein [Desarmillaria tabescens]KAK0454144.1 kinesin-like protein [Desarmillaria tabescens]